MRARSYILGFAATMIAATTASSQTTGAIAKPDSMTKTDSAAPVKSDTADAYAASSLPSLGPNRLVLAAEIGARGFVTRPIFTARAKFDEYKAVPPGPVVLGFLAGYTMGDSVTVIQVNGNNVGQRDQVMRLRGNNPGKYDLQLKWDRIPHTFSTNARSFGSQPTPDVFALRSPRPDTSLWNLGAPYLSPVRTLWNTIRTTATVTPSPKWDLKAEYQNIGKFGSRPMGMAMGSPGNNFREILEPIDQTMQDVRLSEGYASRRFQMVAMYNFSAFHNSFSSVTADNPLIAVDNATTGPSHGRTALAPTNYAHTGILNGSIELPARTRINMSGSYSVWKQDEPFIPPTINSMLTDPRILQIPKHLSAHSGTSSLYVSAVSRPVTPLTLTARFRTYNFRDRVDVDTVPIIVLNDRSISPGETREDLPFTRKSSDIGATWRFSPAPVTFATGYSWETWKRSEARNVADLREGSPRVSMDIGVLDWMSLRTSYTTGRRRIRGQYIQNSTTDQPLHRRFDQADRDRERTSLLATITPVDQITLSGTWTVGHDEYPNSAYGLQSDRSNLEEGDISWSPMERFSMDAGISKENFLTRLESQYRATGQLNNPTYNWVANNRDQVRTITAGFRAILIPDVFEAGGRIEASNARFRMATFNPLTPSGGTAAQNFAATASDLPLVTQKYHPASIFASYVLRPEWTMTARYYIETWSQNDFRTSGLLPSEGGAIFLGNNLDNYTARYFTISFSYRPELLRFPRPAL
jgi:MtrB/PioB family decaheme-associated outer membrane protein